MPKSVKVTGILVFCLALAVNVALAKEEFYGHVEKMPASGTMGEWVIGGRTVVAGKGTELKEKHGKLQVGAYVEVEGIELPDKFVATEIETKEKK